MSCRCDSGTTINPLATVDELATQISDSDARWLVSAPLCLNKALQAADRTDLEQVYVFGDAVDRARAFDVLLAEDAPLPQIAIDVRADVVALPYSSGTTGLQKGVMLTHHNLVANVCQMEGGWLVSVSAVELLLGGVVNGLREETLSHNALRTCSRELSA